MSHGHGYAVVSPGDMSPSNKSSHDIGDIVTLADCKLASPTSWWHLSTCYLQLELSLCADMMCHELLSPSRQKMPVNMNL